MPCPVCETNRIRKMYAEKKARELREANMKIAQQREEAMKSQEKVEPQVSNETNNEEETNNDGKEDSSNEPDTSNKQVISSCPQPKRSTANSKKKHKKK